MTDIEQGPMAVVADLQARVEDLEERVDMLLEALRGRVW